MPESLRDRQGLDVTLAINASNGVEDTETIRLWTERLAVKPKVTTRRKSNLFEEPLGRHNPVAARPLDLDVLAMDHQQDRGNKQSRF
jgi:hypothetical protein